MNFTEFAFKGKETKGPLSFERKNGENFITILSMVPEQVLLMEFS